MTPEERTERLLRKHANTSQHYYCECGACRALHAAVAAGIRSAEADAERRGYERGVREAAEKVKWFRTGGDRPGMVTHWGEGLADAVLALLPGNPPETPKSSPPVPPACATWDVLMRKCPALAALRGNDTPTIEHLRACVMELARALATHCGEHAPKGE